VREPKLAQVIDVGLTDPKTKSKQKKKKKKKNKKLCNPGNFHVL